MKLRAAERPAMTGVMGDLGKAIVGGIWRMINTTRRQRSACAGKDYRRRTKGDDRAKLARTDEAEREKRRSRCLHVRGTYVMHPALLFWCCRPTSTARPPRCPMQQRSVRSVNLEIRRLTRLFCIPESFCRDPFFAPQSSGTSSSPERGFSATGAVDRVSTRCFCPRCHASVHRG